MNKNTLTKAALLAGLVLTPAVIGRYADLTAELLRTEVLLGFGVVATLVALITLEYRRAATVKLTAARTTGTRPATAANVVAFPARAGDDRAAA